MADEAGNQTDVFDDKLDNVSDNETDPEAIFDPEIRNILIRNGSILNMESGNLTPTDILIEDGKIKQLASRINDDAEGIKVIDAAGMIVTPGSIKLTVEEDENTNLSEGVTMMVDNLSYAQAGNILEALDRKKNSLIGTSKTNTGNKSKLFKAEKCF